MRTVLAAAAAPAVLLAAGAAHGSIVELTVTGSWVTGDFDISPTDSTSSPDVPAEDDDQVFGVAPSDGSLSFILRVDTSANTGLFPMGYLSNGTEVLQHDIIGYTDVEIVGGSVSFGDATWNSANILTGLIQVDGLQASLWVDSDLTVGAPDRIRFRMQNSDGDISADLFIGGNSTQGNITDNFAISEFFGGENIASSSYRSTIPAPGAVGLMGLAGLAATRRRR